MELECGFISYLPRNCVMKAIKSASNYDLMMPDVDSSPKKSWWRQSACQPLSHHDFIRPELPHFYSNTLVYRERCHAFGEYGFVADGFITANFPTGLGIDKAAAGVRCALGQRRTLWLGWS